MVSRVNVSKTTACSPVDGLKAHTHKKNVSKTKIFFMKTFIIDDEFTKSMVHILFKYFTKV